MKILQVNLDPSKDADVRSKFFSLLSHLVTSSTARDKGSANGLCAISEFYSFIFWNDQACWSK